MRTTRAWRGGDAVGSSIPLRGHDRPSASALDGEGNSNLRSREVVAPARTSLSRIRRRNQHVGRWKSLPFTHRSKPATRSEQSLQTSAARARRPRAWVTDSPNRAHRDTWVARLTGPVRVPPPKPTGRRAGTSPRAASHAVARATCRWSIAKRPARASRLEHDGPQRTRTRRGPRTPTLARHPTQIVSDSKTVVGNERRASPFRGAVSPRPRSDLERAQDTPRPHEAREAIAALLATRHPASIAPSEVKRILSDYGVSEDALSRAVRSDLLRTATSAFVADDILSVSEQAYLQRLRVLLDVDDAEMKEVERELILSRYRAAVVGALEDMHLAE